MSSPLFDHLERQARDQGPREALHSAAEGLSLSFAQVAERTRRWADTLSEVPPGDLVALAVGNVAAFPELFFALRRKGCPVLSADETLGAVAGRAMGAAWLLQRSGEGDPVPGAPDPAVRLRRLGPGTSPPAGTALVKLTSGSTLDPRGACFTEEALLEGIEHLRLGMELGPSDRVLVSIPLSHSYGFDNGVLSLGVAGTPLVLQSDLMPAAVLRALREREITFFPSVPAVLRALGQVAWPSGIRLRSVLSASAPLPRETAERFRAASGVPVRQFLGATECGGISLETDPDDPRAEGTVGFPLPGVRLEIDPDGSVRVHSAANRFALLPGSGATAPWVATGDRGELTPEGRLRLLGRIRPIGNVGGFKVDLGVIDAFLRGLPGVEEALTVPVDDPARGQRLVAWVESGAQTPARLLELCRERLSAREVPSEIRVLARLPRTARGKLDVTALAGRGP